MLIRRYLVSELLQTFVAVLSVVLLIAISNKLVRLISRAASGQISPDVLMQLVIFQLPELLAFLLPIALFLAILLTFGRFYVDNEIPVLFACGMSWRRLVSICLMLAIVVACVSGALSLYVSPYIAQVKEKTIHNEGPLFLAQTIAPGRFYSLQNDKYIFYVANMSSDRKELKQIFVVEKDSPSSEYKTNLIVAQSGNVLVDDKKQSIYLKLNHGKRYQGGSQQSDYQILQFEHYERLLESEQKDEELYFHRSMPTAMLLNHPSPSNQAEFQWRLAMPLAVFLLAVLAVPLSRIPPREGRFGRIFYAVIICIVYFNLLTIAKRWVHSQTISSELGLWWVHGLLLVSTLIFMFFVSGKARQWRYAFMRTNNE